MLLDAKMENWIKLTYKSSELICFYKEEPHPPPPFLHLVLDWFKSLLFFHYQIYLSDLTFEISSLKYFQYFTVLSLASVNFPQPILHLNFTLLVLYSHLEH